MIAQPANVTRPIPQRYEDEYPEDAQALMDICEERRILKSQGKRLVPISLDNPHETFITKIIKVIEGVIPIKSGVTTVGRNDPCTCGSGKKFKKCCIMKEKTNES